MINVPHWLTMFFGAGNLLCIDKLLGENENSYPDDLKIVLLPLLESALDGQWPIILPWCDKQHWVFFAASENERAMLELSNVLKARFGSADVIPDQRVVLAPSEGPTAEAEAVMLKHCPAGMIRIELLPEKRTDKSAKRRVFDALKEVIDLFRLRPSLVRTIKRPFGRILSDFILANKDRDEIASNGYLQELRDSGGLSQRNIVLLELQQAGKLRKWDILLNHEKLPDLIRGRITSSLVKMLLNAYQQCYFNANSSNYTQYTPTQLRAPCLSLYPLFTQVPLLLNDESCLRYWKTWAIGTVLVGEVSLLDAVPESLKTNYIPALLSWGGRFSTAMQRNSTLLPVAPPNSLQILAEQLKYSLTATQEELPRYEAMLNSLDASLLERAYSVPLLKNLIDGIYQLSAPQIVGWDMWFVQFCQPNADINSLVQLVALESEHWPTQTFYEKTLIRVLSVDLPEGACSVLRNIMPSFVEWLELHQIVLNSSTWLKWIDVLAMEQSVSQSDIKLVVIASNYFLQSSFNQLEYENFIATLQLIIERSSSLKNLPSLSELMEIFLDGPCLSISMRKALWMDIQTIVGTLWLRLDYQTRMLMRNHAKDVMGEGAEQVYPGEMKNSSIENIENTSSLVGKLVAIYTLTEGVARRTKIMLEELFNGVKVEINNDRTSTNRLVHLAEKADYFIFSSASAKHQAFYAVTSRRKKIIYPLGKGSASLVHAFIDTINSSA